MSTEPVRELNAMLRGLSPRLLPGTFAFCTTTDAQVFEARVSTSLGHFREREGWSLLLPLADAQHRGLRASEPMRCITLDLNSALDGVGLTAAVASVLAESGIACNMVAAFHHDNVFVPAGQAEAAMELLSSLQRAQV